MKYLFSEKIASVPTVIQKQGKYLSSERNNLHQ